MRVEKLKASRSKHRGCSSPTSSSEGAGGIDINSPMLKLDARKIRNRQVKIFLNIVFSSNLLFLINAVSKHKQIKKHSRSSVLEGTSG